MKCSVKAYYNTGFDFNNIPDTPALLESVQNVRTFDSVYIKQDRDIINIKIAAQYKDIEGVDYISLKEENSNKYIYYYVTAINMINDNVANLTLLEDVLTTEGGAANLDYIDGWCTRKSVSSDNLFENIIPESYSPIENLVINNFPINFSNPDTFEEEYITVVASTVDLESDELYKANVFVGDSAEGDYSVVVPSLPALTKPTKFTINFTDGSSEDGIFPAVGLYIVGKASTAGSSIYNDDGRIEKAIATLRGLGLENVIIASYKIPTEYINSIRTIDNDTGDLSHGFIYEIDSNAIRFPFGSEDSGLLNFTYSIDNYTIKNNKVYSLYNNVTVFNRASGDSNTYNMYDIYDSESLVENIPFFTLSSDLSPNGGPIVRPEFYKHNKANKYTFSDNSVSGGNWLNTPIAFSTASGNLINAANYALIKQQGEADWEKKMLGYQDFNYYTQYASSLTSDAMNSLGISFKEDISYKDWLPERINMSPSLGGILSTGGKVHDFVKGDSFKFDELAIESLARQAMSERLNYEISQKVVTPDIRFSSMLNSQVYFGNLFGAFTTRLSEKDVKRFDEYLTRYGYKVSEPLSSECFSGRENFNFVEANNVAIGKDISIRRKTSIKRLFNLGVRVWHKLPSVELLNNNPIVTQ